jgi:hypothetical protein
MATSELERARALKPGAPDAVLVEGLMEQLGRTLDLRPPTNLHIAASYQHIKHIVQAPIDWAGMLTPSPDGSFVMTVRSSDRSHRKNFTIGHEITHTFLPGYTVVQFRCGGASLQGFIGGPSLEALADVGAAELLLPRRYLGPVFADTAFRMSAIKRVADFHHASLDATLRQLLHLTETPGIFVDVRRTVSSRGITRTAIHRVFSNSQWCPVAPSQLSGTQIPESHPLSTVLDSGEVDDVLDLSLVRTTTRTGQVSAIADPFTDNEGRLVMRSLILATPRRAQSFSAASQLGRLPAVS